MAESQDEETEQPRTPRSGDASSDEEGTPLPTLRLATQNLCAATTKRDRNKRTANFKYKALMKVQGNKSSSADAKKAAEQAYQTALDASVAAERECAEAKKEVEFLFLSDSPQKPHRSTEERTAESIETIYNDKFLKTQDEVAIEKAATPYHATMLFFQDESKMSDMQLLRSAMFRRYGNAGFAAQQKLLQPLGDSQYERWMALSRDKKLCAVVWHKCKGAIMEHTFCVTADVMPEHLKAIKPGPNENAKEFTGRLLEYNALAPSLIADMMWHEASQNGHDEIEKKTADMLTAMCRKSLLNTVLSAFPVVASRLGGTEVADFATREDKETWLQKASRTWQDIKLKTNKPATSSAFAVVQEQEGTKDSMHEDRRERIYGKRKAEEAYLAEGDEDDKRSTKPCFSYRNKGKCNRGEDCHFSHNLTYGDRDEYSRNGSRGGRGRGGRSNRGGRGGRNNNNGNGNGNNTNQSSECRNWRKQGSCKFGDKCRFEHNGGGGASRGPSSKEERKPQESTKEDKEPPAYMAAFVKQIGDLEKQVTRQSEFVRSQQEREEKQRQEDQQRGFIAAMVEPMFKRYLAKTEASSKPNNYPRLMNSSGEKDEL
jgi:hypothetical protein